MRRKVIIGVALLVVVSLLTACGIPQEDFDAAVADKEAAEAQVASLQSDLAAAQSDLATAQSDLATAQSDLATAQSDLAASEDEVASANSQVSSLESEVASLESDLAAAEATIADLEAAAPAEEEEEVAEEEEEVAEEEEEEVAEEEEEVAEELSFEAATYTNEEYGFSVKYISDWTAQDDLSASYIIMWVSGDFAGYPFPGMRIFAVTDAESADDALTAAHDSIEIASTTEVTLADGTAASESKITYISDTGSMMDARTIAVQKDGTWIVVSVYTVGAYIPVDEAQYSEMLHTLAFQ